MSKTTNEESDEQRPSKIEQPPNFWPVFTKLSQCVLWIYIVLVYTPRYPVEYNLSEKMVNSPFINRLAFLFFSVFCVRVKYYFAFILSEAINNAAGLGFNGYDKSGIPEWDLLTNVKPLQLETATSLKVVIDVWNIQTAIWLRRVCYDRLPNGRTLGVFVISAFWHGFYPGYYVCFILAAFETYAGRGIRRQIRPYFQVNQTTKYIYACITWFGTQIGVIFFCNTICFNGNSKSLVFLSDMVFYCTVNFNYSFINIECCKLKTDTTRKRKKKIEIKLLFFTYL